MSPLTTADTAVHQTPVAVSSRSQSANFRHFGQARPPTLGPDAARNSCARPRMCCRSARELR